jgi:hypothetical protein
MRGPFIGTEALSRGEVTRHELQRWYTWLLPDVYVARGAKTDLRDRIRAAWLWSGRRGVIAGVAASAMYGADWIDDDVPVELVWRNGRPPEKLIVRNDTLAPSEVTRIAGISVTTPARTAFDLGRLLPRDQAVARIDALLWRVPSALHGIQSVIDRHPGVRGVKRLPIALDLADCGAQSPKETWLRLLFIDAGLPRPATQIRVYDGRRLVRVLDMGWEKYKVAAEYDGDQHRTRRAQYVKDIQSKRTLARLRWESLNVVNEDDPDFIVDWARRALEARGWRPGIPD